MEFLLTKAFGSGPAPRALHATRGSRPELEQRRATWEDLDPRRPKRKKKNEQGRHRNLVAQSLQAPTNDPSTRDQPGWRCSGVKPIGSYIVAVKSLLESQGSSMFQFQDQRPGTVRKGLWELKTIALRDRIPGDVQLPLNFQEKTDVLILLREKAYNFQSEEHLAQQPVNHASTEAKRTMWLSQDVICLDERSKRLRPIQVAQAGAGGGVLLLLMNLGTKQEAPAKGLHKNSFAAFAAFADSKECKPLAASCSY